jgi:hypothetical protein
MGRGLVSSGRHATGKPTRNAIAGNAGMQPMGLPGMRDHALPESSFSEKLAFILIPPNGNVRRRHNRYGFLFYRHRQPVLATGVIS